MILGDVSSCPHAGQRIHPFVSLPFGYGRRMCIGRRFAENELHILVAKVTNKKSQQQIYFMPNGHVFLSIVYIWLYPSPFPLAVLSKI